MNFDQIIEALGLQKLAATASGSRSGTGGTGQPPPETGPQQPGPPEELGGDAEQSADESTEDDGASPPLDWSPDDESDATDEEDDALDGSMEEIHHQIDQIAADVSANTSQIRGVQSQQEEVLERLETIEEHNSQLLGVYDRLTAGINPFAEGWEARYDRVRENAEESDHRYNVVELPDGVEQDPVAPGDAEPSPEPEAGPPEAEAGTDDEAVGFEELRERQGAVEEAPQSDSPDASDAERAPAGTGGATGETAGDAYLETLAQGYATEVLLMEWLTALIDIAGAPGTLKALDYYESIGWISRPVKHRLEDLLGGARVEAETPVRTPGDLTTEEHNRSFAYIMKLAQEHQSRPTVGID